MGFVGSYLLGGPWAGARLLGSWYLYTRGANGVVVNRLFDVPICRVLSCLLGSATPNIKTPPDVFWMPPEEFLSGDATCLQTGARELLYHSETGSTISSRSDNFPRLRGRGCISMCDGASLARAPERSQHVASSGCSELDRYSLVTALAATHV